jgi:ankyrin repeat protein
MMCHNRIGVKGAVQQKVSCLETAAPIQYHFGRADLPMRLRETLWIAPVIVCGIAYAAPPSPVAEAAMKGDRLALRSLLEQKANVNAAQADGATAIQWAAYRDDLEIADLLISAGADVRTANRDGATALSLASINGSASMVERLIKAGADPNERGPTEETPLMFAARNGRVEAIRVLLDHHAEVNAREKLRGTTALMWAAEQMHPAAVKLLIERGADFSGASNADAKGGTAYLAPTAKQRAINDGIALDGTFIGNARRGRLQNGTNNAAVDVSAADAAAADAAFNRTQNAKGGGLTPLIFAARQGDLETARILVEAGAKVNQTSRYGWTPLLTAVQNRHYQLGAYLLAHGADPNLPNNGGWTPLYIATDNRNIEAGDYPVRTADMDHLDFIKLLLDGGADVNARVCGVESTPQQCKGDSTETRTIFTMQWLYEDGATPFLRAAQSGDVELMKLLLAHGADPHIATANGDTALMVASGVGWVEGVTFEWSPAETVEAVRICLDLGIDPNLRDNDGRAALHGAAHKGSNEVVQLLVDRGAKLDMHDNGGRDTISGSMFGHTWLPIEYAQGLVRVGVQSALAHPDTEAIIQKLMEQRGLEVPPRIKSSVCLAIVCSGYEP